MAFTYIKLYIKIIYKIYNTYRRTYRKSILAVILYVNKTNKFQTLIYRPEMNKLTFNLLALLINTFLKLINYPFIILSRLSATWTFIIITISQMTRGFPCSGIICLYHS